MNVMVAIAERRSIRSFSGRPVEEEKLLRVLEAGRLAPSARNMQDWKFVVVKDPSIRRRLAEAARNQEFVGQAPIVIAACGTSDYVMTCGQHTYTIDVAIALDHMTLAAVEEDLGTCWIGAFYEDKVKEILGEYLKLSELSLCFPWAIQPRLQRPPRLCPNHANPWKR